MRGNDTMHLNIFDVNYNNLYFIHNTVLTLRPCSKKVWDSKIYRNNKEWDFVNHHKDFWDLEIQL